MTHANDDQSSELAKETWLDRRLDKADEEIWKWVLVGLIGAAGSLLADAIPPMWLGVSTATLLALWLISFLRVRRLKQLLDSRTHTTVAPAPVMFSHNPSPSASGEMTQMALSILCMIYDAHNQGHRLRLEDFQRRLKLKLTEAELAAKELLDGEYVYQDESDRLDADSDEFHLLPKGNSYVTSRRGQRPRDMTYT